MKKTKKTVNTSMKKLYLGIALILCAQQCANAQLLNTDGVINQVDKVNLDNITREVDTAAERINRQTERTLENVKPTIEIVTDTASAITTNTLADPLRKLPQQLPILNSAGNTAFVEAEVEHGFRAVQREWIIMLDESELVNLQKLPVDILEKTRFDELELTLVRFRVPAELDSLSALKKRLPDNVSLRLDRNHIYSSQASPSANILNANNGASSICTTPITIGMIDTAINLDHPAFKKNAGNVVQKNFLDESLVSPDAHGTAVAGLLVGDAVDDGNEIKPLLPNAKLLSASVFYERNEYSQGATIINLVRAMNWLMSENVSVINMSLAGPDNQILAKVMAKAISSGKIIVAAAGNEGPAAPPMFPAAYSDVIAVTAVDREQHIYRWANRGNHIYFSALGVSVLTARSSGGFGRESGTSMASPVVAAFIACELQREKDFGAVIKNLAAKAIDLGEKGRDDIFGYGLLQSTQ